MFAPSRTAFGRVTCPFTVTLVANLASVILISERVILAPPLVDDLLLRCLAGMTARNESSGDAPALRLPQIDRRNDFALSKTLEKGRVLSRRAFTWRIQVDPSQYGARSVSGVLPARFGMLLNAFSN